jgi:hypothetical protein
MAKGIATLVTDAYVTFSGIHDAQCAAPWGMSVAQRLLNITNWSWLLAKSRNYLDGNLLK